MVKTLCFQGAAWLRSRRFLFHQLIQRDKAQPVVLDVDVLHDLSRLRVNEPMFLVIRVFHIAVRHIDRQRYSTLSLALLNSPNLAAGIADVKLVEPVLNARKIIVYAVRVNGVVVVVNGNVANAIPGKGEVYMI